MFKKIIIALALALSLAPQCIVAMQQQQQQVQKQKQKLKQKVNPKPKEQAATPKEDEEIVQEKVAVASEQPKDEEIEQEDVAVPERPMPINISPEAQDVAQQQEMAQQKTTAQQQLDTAAKVHTCIFGPEHPHCDQCGCDGMSPIGRCHRTDGPYTACAGYPHMLICIICGAEKSTMVL